MKLILTKKEIEQVLLDILCSALSKTIHSGIQYGYNKENYNKFKKEGNCWEDNLILLLKGGGRIKFVDVEGGDGEHTFLTLKSATEKLKSISDTNIIAKVKDILSDESNSDAWDAWDILQYILYGEVIYG